MATLHATPSFCRSGSCSCPEFDPGSDGDASTHDHAALVPCDLCDHPAAYHLPRLELDPAHAKMLKDTVGEALEHCKNSLGEGNTCSCPCFVGVDLKAKSCALCKCKRGWHKWKEVPIPTATSPSIAPTDFSSSRAPSSLGSYPVGAFVASLQATAPPAPSPTTSSSGHFSSARHDSWGSSTAPSSVSAASAYPSPPLASPVGLASPPTLASLTLNTVSSPPAPPPVPNTYAAPSPLELSPQASIAGVRDASPVFSAKGKEPARERSNTTAEEQQREKIAMYNNASQQQRARELSNESAGSVAMSRMSSSRSSRHSSIGPPSEPAPTSPLPQLPPPSQQASPAVLVRAQRAYAPSPSTSLDNLSPYEVEDDSRDHDDDEEDDDDDDASILDPNPMGAPSSLAASRLSFGTTRAESGSTYPDDELEDIPPVPQISRRHVSPLGPSPLAPTPAPAPAPIPPPSRESVEMAGWRAAAAEAAARGQRRASQTVLSSSPEQIRPQLPRVTPASPPMRARSQRSIPPSNSLGKVSSPPLFQSTQQNQHQPQHPYGNYPAPSPSPPIAAVAGPSSPPARRPFTNPSIITSAYDASNRDRHDSLGSSNASTVHIGHRHGSISSENAPPLPTPQRSATLSTPDEEAIWRDYRSKSFTLAVSPPIDSGRWKPGQVFMFRLTLGPKASKTSFDKLDVRLVGSSYVHMEPPDNHDFMSVRASIFPTPTFGQVKEVGQGQRVFAWEMRIPWEQTCDCSVHPLQVPSTYGHSNFRIEYFVEVLSRKEVRFRPDQVEKLKIHFAIDSPSAAVSRVLSLSPSVLSSASAPRAGWDGRWRTYTKDVDLRLGPTGPRVHSVELAYLLLPSTHSPSSLRLSYRLSFILFPPSPNQVPIPIDLAVLERAHSALSTTVSRKVIVTRTNSKKGKSIDLPILRITQKEVKERNWVENVSADGRDRVWRNEGSIEVSSNDAKSLTTCAVTVRFNLRATIPATTGLTSPIDIFASEIPLELPTSSIFTSPTITASSNLSPAPLPPLQATNISLTAALARTTDDALERTTTTSSTGTATSVGQQSLIHQFPGVPPPATEEPEEDETLSLYGYGDTEVDGEYSGVEDDEDGVMEEPPPPFEDAVRNDVIDWVRAEERFH